MSPQWCAETKNVWLAGILIWKDLRDTPFIEARRLRKTFRATRALDDVSLDLGRGECHALIGENGAGKSTLIKILGGVHQADGGELRVDGSAMRFASPADALSAGIVVIPQEIRDVPAASVAENTLLGSVPLKRRFGLVPELDRRALRERARELLRSLDVHLDIDRPVRSLGHAERQLVMIARALGREARLLVLDEPTASLEGREVERLFRILDALKRDGVALVYVSHRLDEVERIADRVTVLRDGRRVASGARGEFTRQEMATLMTGRDLEVSEAGNASITAGKSLLETPDVHLQAGEIVGLAGLLGSGTTELLLRCYGAADRVETVSIDGDRTALRSPHVAISRGIGLVPGDRALGLIMGLSVRENIVLPALDRFRNAWGLDNAAVNDFVSQLMETLDIRPRDPDRPVRGNCRAAISRRLFSGAGWPGGHVSFFWTNQHTVSMSVHGPMFIA